MKTAMKKLLSFVLVAVLLVSAVPFQASAEAISKYPCKITIDGQTFTYMDADGSLTEEELYNELETEKRDDAALDAAIAKYTFPMDVTSGTVVIDLGQVSEPDPDPAPTPTPTPTPTPDPNPGDDGDEGRASTPPTTTYDVTIEAIAKDDSGKKYGSETKTGLTEAEFVTIMGSKNFNIGNFAASVSDLVAGTKFADATKYELGSATVSAVNGNSVTFTLYVTPKSDDVKPDEPTATNYKVTVDYGDYGVPGRVETVPQGTNYLKRFGEPTGNPKQNFVGWMSDKLGRIITSSDVVLSDDTITAIWSAPNKYTITFIDERGSEPTVTKAYQMSYGERFGDVFGEKLENLTTPSDRKGYVFMGWKINGKKVTADTVYEWQGDVTAYASWALESDTPGVPVGGEVSTTKGKVYLEIYTNDNVKELVKRVNITDYADDNKITRKEVEKVVKKYLAAKSGYSLKMIGLFDEESWWWYTRDEETNGEDTIVVNRDGDDYVYVMVKNVKTAKRDETNPKTGDPMVTTMTVMTLSATTLALVYFFNKKRMFVK